MRFYYDFDLGRLVQAPGYPGALNRVDFKRGDAAEIRLGFYRGGRQVSIGSGALLRFALKPSGKYDVDPVVSGEAWSFVDDSNPEYFCNPSFNTVALNALFNHADGNYGNDVASVDLMFEITWSLDDEVTWSSTDTVTARVYNDVIKGDEGVPLEGPPAYPTSVQVHHLTDNITVTEPINLDNLEGIVGPAGADGATGADGADSTVPGPQGPAGADGVDSTVPGPQGPAGADGADNANLDTVTSNGATTTNDIQVGRIVTAGNTLGIGATDGLAIGGTGNSALGAASEVIGGGGSSATGTGSTIVGGNASNNAGNWAIIAGGRNHSNTGGARAGTLAGEHTTITHADSAMLAVKGTGQVNKQSQANQTAHVDNLHIFEGGFKMPTGASDGDVLTADANGNGTWQAAEQTNTPQVVLSNGNPTLGWDHALGSTVKHTLTNDIFSVNISNVADGDSGLIILRQDGNGPWILQGDGYISDQLTSQRILAGDLASISTVLTSEVITLGWIYDGQAGLILYYVSDISVTPGL